MSSQVHLFLLPYAGATARVFQPLHKIMPEVQLHPLDPPGHGARFDEPSLTRLEEILDDLIERHGEEITTPYAVYGHSFGGKIAEPLIDALLRRGWGAPVRLFVSGCSPPGARSVLSGSERKSDDEFLETLQAVGAGFPLKEEFPDFYEHYLRVLRADFTVISNLPEVAPPPLDIPITVFWSPGDIMKADEVKGWANASRGEVRFVELTGNHFFPLRHLERIGAEIRRDLLGAQQSTVNSQ